MAFVSNRENRVGIWAVSYLGGTPVLLTSIEINPINFKLIKWSNDGKRIFFETSGKLKIIELGSGKIEEIGLPEFGISSDFSVSNDEKLITYSVNNQSQQNVWVQTLGKIDAKQITNNQSVNVNPVFFPDNQRIAYTSNQNGNFQIYYTDLIGSDPVQLTFGDSNASHPKISPDRSKIIYYSDTDEANVFSFDLRLNKETARTSNTKMQLFPSFSPNNDKFVFQVTDEKAKLTQSPLKIKNLENESEPIQITQSVGFPKWSPDQDSITFIKHSENLANIWRIEPISLKETQITHQGISIEGYTVYPFNLMSIPFSWSKNQKKLLYSSKQSGFYNIWMVDENGSNEEMLTNNEDNKLKYSSPVWSSDETQIAFSYRLQLEPNKFKYGISILSTGKTINLYENDSLIRLLGWKQNGNELFAAVKNDEDVEIVKISTTPNIKPITVTKLKSANIHGIILSPDSGKIVFSARRDDFDNLFLYSINGKEIKLTANLDSTILYSGITWANDGNNLLYSKQFGGMQISMISERK